MKQGKTHVVAAGTRPKTMTSEDESSLAKYVLIWADRGLALSKRAVKKHALDIIKSRGYDRPCRQDLDQTREDV